MRVFERISVVALLVAALALVWLNVAAWRGSLPGSDDSTPRTGTVSEPAPPIADVAPEPPPRAQTRAPAQTPPAALRDPTSVQRPSTATSVITIRASRGDCWLSVRSAGQGGDVLYEGVLELGASVRFVQRAVWIRLGAASHVDAAVDGKPVPVPAGTVEVTLPEPPASGAES
jgi:hypothetical protein